MNDVLREHGGLTLFNSSSPRALQQIHVKPEGV